MNRSVIFATDSSEEDSSEEEADEEEPLDVLLDAGTGFLDKDAGWSSFFEGLVGVQDQQGYRMNPEA